LGKRDNFTKKIEIYQNKGQAKKLMPKKQPPAARQQRGAEKGGAVGT
jgi:hypothetical protein